MPSAPQIANGGDILGDIAQYAGVSTGIDHIRTAWGDEIKLRVSAA